jgi:hypothetical protein
MFANLLPRLLQLSFAAVLSFSLGAMTGAVTSYVAVRTDMAALTARVVVQEQRATALEQSVAEWRTTDARTAADLSAQLKAAADILTDLRIRLGPTGTPHR